MITIEKQESENQAPDKLSIHAVKLTSDACIIGIGFEYKYVSTGDDS